MLTNVEKDNIKIDGKLNEVHKFLFLLIILIIYVVPFITKSIQRYHYFPTDNLLFKIINYLPFLMTCFIYIKQKKLKLKNDLLIKKTPIQNYLYAILFGILLQPLIFWSGSFSVFLHTGEVYLPDKILINLSTNSLSKNITGILTTGLIAAILEEISFRGILLNSYKGVNVFIAILMNGLLFFLAHFDFFRVFTIIPIGILLTLLTIVSKSILPSIILHLMLNSFHYMLSIISYNFMIHFYNFLFSPLISLLFFAAVILLSSFLLIKHIYPLNKKNKEKQKLPFKLFDRYVILLIILVIKQSLIDKYASFPSS
ncbi:CPBP family intramembrane glutamic endopeptidase [Gottfriedia luciferensis]|uniref:CPBP family intramembrane glutamic endopeptidase n=1 Tax=Gottfriedia luciferensis TaxID=178774 RepID=UPI000B43D4CB|nr:type II CAAX endopeptidase family protein [Gottfriedia luciferensis]